ncbi:hypothetical protein UABAM_04966 [Candidatus Uabimicrobium amorphum]|uniref:Sulfatase-modifying factor enzyme-like domain-containing protein n=1 Tax=Uabimicrobium amorphum TaxID=2596890 RepID=A0A5S9ISZ7_UABAM|nr:formylglycine-generating enzyme family protein [Candidatus Uabimicrobium amorphum]BBM86580.1 hypothetical protein UABAM_04966 [Candidatus Uabimicrobium amorphum]
MDATIELKYVQQNLPHLLQYLKSLGYGTTVPQMQAVQSVLVVLVAEGRDELAIAKLTNYIGPLVCSSPPQQQNFAPYFHRFCKSITPSDEVVADEDDIVVHESEEIHVFPWKIIFTASVFVLIFGIAVALWEQPQKYLLSGYVVDQHGKGVTDVEVKLGDSKKYTPTTGYFYHTITTKRDKTSLEISYSNYQKTHEISLQKPKIELGKIVLRKTMIRGKVQNENNESLQGVELQLLTNKTTSDANGDYQFTFYINEQKKAKISAQLADYFAYEDEIALDEDAKTHNITMKKIPTYELSVTVIGEAKAAVSDAQVTFAGQSVVFDKDVYKISYPGTIEQAVLIVDHRDYLPWKQEIKVEAKQKLTVQLQPLVTHNLQGEVYNEAGVAVWNAEVQFLGEKVVTNKEGEFAFTFRTREQQAYVHIEHPNYQSWQQLVKIEGENIRLPRITLTERAVTVYDLMSQMAGNYATMIAPPIPFWVWFAIVIVIVIILERLWWRKLYYIKKQQLYIADGEEQQRLEVKNPPPLFPETINIPQIQTLQQRRHVFSSKIDFEATAKATADAAGMFTPVYHSQRLAPEYLALVDRNAMQDHNAQWAMELLRHLRKSGISVKILYFNEDPRNCYDENNQRCASLGQMAYQYYQHRLLIFSNGNGMFDPFNNCLYDWVERFDEWDIRSFFTPEPTSNWGYREWALAKMDFVMFSTNSIGVEAFSRLMAGEEVSSTDVVSWNAQLPALLTEDNERWLEERRPSPRVIAQLQQTLQQYLDAPGYRWLQRCAVYPQIHWSATLYLGHMRDAEGNKLFSERRLLQLMRLPWFRHGTMPQWLREHLQQELSYEERKLILDAIQHLQPLGVLYLRHDDIAHRAHNFFHLRGRNTPFARQTQQNIEQKLQKEMHKYKPRHLFAFREDQPLRGQKISDNWQKVFTTKDSSLSPSLRLQEVHRILPQRHYKRKFFIAACALIIVSMLWIQLSKISMPQAWDSKLWKVCWNTEEEYLDFTTEEWGVLSHEKQVELARSYQEWYAAEKGLQLTKEMTKNGVNFVFKMIPPGKFWMGSPKEEKDRDNNEVRHKVRISKAYWVGETEVTQGQWQAVMGENPSRSKEVGLQGPVERVSWNDCQEFCKKAGMRLLTEAEWEYACRAGTTRAYNLGDSIDTLKVHYGQDWFDGQTVVVKSLSNMNSWSCYDFHGNVAEWCEDKYGKYTNKDTKDPVSKKSSDCVLRGGDWHGYAEECRSSCRDKLRPDHYGDYTGFRVVPVPQ